MMIQEPNENFGMDDRNFHLADEGINSETMENKDPAINQHEVDKSDAVYEAEDSELDNYSRNDYDPYQDDLDDEDIDENVDEDLDDDGDDLDDDDLDDTDSDEDFDEKDRSDY